MIKALESADTSQGIRENVLQFDNSDDMRQVAAWLFNHGMQVCTDQRNNMLWIHKGVARDYFKNFPKLSPQSDSCICGHSLAVHLGKCNVRLCPCKTFKKI